VVVQKEFGLSGVSGLLTVISGELATGLFAGKVVSSHSFCERYVNRILR
jgi:hypothetical protein